MPLRATHPILLGLALQVEPMESRDLRVHGDQSRASGISASVTTIGPECRVTSPRLTFESLPVPVTVYHWFFCQSA